MRSFDRLEREKAHMSILTPHIFNIASDPARAARAVDHFCERIESARDPGPLWQTLTTLRNLYIASNRWAMPQHVAVVDLVDAVVGQRTASGDPLTRLFVQQGPDSPIYQQDAATSLELIREGGGGGLLEVEAMELIRQHHAVMVCDHCDQPYLARHMQRVARRDSEYVCRDCRSDDDVWIYSTYYGGWLRRDGAGTGRLANGDFVTIDETDESFFWNDLEQEYHHVDRRRQVVICPYHSSKDLFVPQVDNWSRGYDGRLFGVELEVEVVNGGRPEDVARGINAVVNVDGRKGSPMFFERDGSLTSGFELITQPMSLPVQREFWTRVLAAPDIWRNVRSHRTTTCGLHVHVSRAGLTNLTIARAVTFIHDPRNDAFVQALARRYNTGFCKYVEKDLATAHTSHDRYEALNITGRETVEFRLFRGSLKADAVVAALEFSHALLEFCAREQLDATGLNARAFITWCSRNLPDDTATLRSYVEQRTAGTYAHAAVA
jgi:hypothetical protein